MRSLAFVDISQTFALWWMSVYSMCSPMCVQQSSWKQDETLNLHYISSYYRVTSIDWFTLKWQKNKGVFIMVNFNLQITKGKFIAQGNTAEHHIPRGIRIVINIIVAQKWTTRGTHWRWTGRWNVTFRQP